MPHAKPHKKRSADEIGSLTIHGHNDLPLPDPGVEGRAGAVRSEPGFEGHAIGLDSKSAALIGVGAIRPEAGTDADVAL